MSEIHKKQESENWKADEIRQERKQRLAEMKDKDGGKKPIQKKGRRTRIVALLVAIALVIAFGLWFASTVGLRQRNTKAFTVSYDERKAAESEDEAADSEDSTESSTAQVIGDVTVSEANIYLGLLSQQMMQGGAFSQTGQDQLSQPSQFSPNHTLRDDFIIAVKNQAKTAEYFYWQAEKEGLALAEEDLEQVDMIVEQYELIAAQSEVTLNHLLSTMFGPGVNEKEFRNFFEKNQLGNKYYLNVNDSFVYDEARITARYEEDPDQYNYVDYHSYLFTGQDTSAELAEGELPEPDLELAKKEADEFAELVKNPASFSAEVLKLEIQETKKEDAVVPEEIDSSLTQEARKMALSPELADWLFSEERKADDTAVIEEAGGYRVVMFIDKYKPIDTGSYDSRHILFAIDENDPEKTDAKMKAKAEDVLAEYLAGEQTEAFFGELAREYSDDTGSATENGLIENVQPGQFVAEYEAFCLDPSRQSGDVEIVETDYGYHIIYFVDAAEQWYVSVLQELKNEDQQEFMFAVNRTTDIQEEKGIKYFGKP